MYDGTGTNMWYTGIWYVCGVQRFVEFSVELNPVMSPAAVYIWYHKKHRSCAIAIACACLAVIMSDVCSIAAGKKRGLPTDGPPEVPDGVHLCEGYKPRRCKFCMVWSTAKCPWDLVGSILEAWNPLIPWARGNKDKPSGESCKVCVIASRLLC